MQNPLAKGYSRETIARNISKLRREGFPENRAVAASFREARKWFEKYNPGVGLLEYLREPNPLESETNQGRRLYSGFVLRQPNASRRVNVPALPKVAVDVGKLHAVEYVSNRGGRQTLFRHVFKKGSRPLLAASHDGKQLILLGGAFRFTNRGIVDRSG